MKQRNTTTTNNNNNNQKQQITNTISDNTQSQSHQTSQLTLIDRIINKYNITSTERGIYLRFILNIILVIGFYFIFNFILKTDNNVSSYRHNNNQLRNINNNIVLTQLPYNVESYMINFYINSNDLDIFNVYNDNSNINNNSNNDLHNYIISNMLVKYDELLLDKYLNNRTEFNDLVYYLNGFIHEFIELTQSNQQLLYFYNNVYNTTTDVIHSIVLYNIEQCITDICENIKTNNNIITQQQSKVDINNLLNNHDNAYYLFGQYSLNGNHNLLINLINLANNNNNTAYNICSYYSQKPQFITLRTLYKPDNVNDNDNNIQELFV